MQINSVSNQNFGKIRVDKDVKEVLSEHVAYGLANDSFKTFSEKYRLCNLSDTVDLTVTKEGVTVRDNKSGETKDFAVKAFDENSPNILFHLLNAAMNYAFIKDGQMFKE